MKKALAILAAMALLLTFAACGNTAGTATTAETQDTAAEKQSLYESFFREENYKTAGKSVTIGNPQARISIIQDANDETMMEIKVLENYIRFYQLKDGKTYVNTKLVAEDGTAEETWGSCEDENSEDLLESMDLDQTALELDFSTITKIEYLNSKDGADVVQIHQKDPDFVEGTVTKEYCIKFVYEGEDCEMVITTQIDPEGGEATDYDTQKVAEDFAVHDYTLDYENKLLVHWEDESKNIPFELVSEKTDTEAKELSFDFYIDEKTREVTSIETVQDGETVTYTFFEVASCMEGVEIPDDLETYDAESLAMMLLGILFSGINVE